MRTRCLSVLAVVVSTLVGAAPAAAEEPLGEPWEAGIEDGVARQLQEQEREGRTAEAILRQARLMAARRTDATTRVVRLYLLARAYGLSGDAASAASTYREVLGLAPRCYFAYHDLAMLALQQQPPNAAMAERYLRQALRIHPRYLTAHRKLARILLDANRGEEARGVLKRIVDLEPGDLQARFLLAKVLLDLAQLDEAEREVAFLVRREPKVPAYRELKGDLYLARGRHEDALRVYERLAREHPAASQPLRRYMRVLNELRTTKNEFDRERWLWAMEGLLRTATDEKERAQLRAAIDELRRPRAEQPTPLPEGPPTDAMIVSALDRAGAPDRVAILRYVYAREEAPSGPLLEALIRRLAPGTESSGEVRQWVLRVLGRFGGFGLVGLVRHSLGDPDPTVRPVAADTLVSLAITEPAARGAALLTLGLHTQHPDAALASAARSAVLELADAALPSTGGDAYARRQEAFRTWWEGTAAGEAKIQALEQFPQVGDRYPEDVIVPYLRDPDAFVVEAAWRAMGQAAGGLRAEPSTSAARRRWFAELPAFEAGAATGPQGVAVRERLRGWAARKPGS